MVAVLRCSLRVSHSYSMTAHGYYFLPRSVASVIFLFIGARSLDDMWPLCCGQFSIRSLFIWVVSGRRQVHWSSPTFSFSHQAWTKSYKRATYIPPYSSVPSHSTHQEDYNRLPTFSTMLFHKSVVSFVTAIALASSVTAFAKPGPARLARAGPPSCLNGGTPTCCNSIASFSSLPQNVQTALTNADPSLNQGLNVGLTCTTAGSQAWYRVPQFLYSIKWLTRRRSSNQGLCCDAIVNLNLPISRCLSSPRSLPSDLADNRFDQQMARKCPTLPQIATARRDGFLTRNEYLQRAGGWWNVSFCVALRILRPAVVFCYLGCLKFNTLFSAASSF